MRGKLIVVEGLDNVGKTTFVQYFLKQNPLVIPRKFPSKHVAETMNQIKYADIKWDVFHDLFHNDLQNGIDQIGEILDGGASVICDRFYYSHWVYENLRYGQERVCLFHTGKVIPDVVVYLRPRYIERLQTQQGKDNLEYGIDYVKGQKEFDRILHQEKNLLTIPALEWNTNDEAMKALHLVLGVYV